MHELELTPENRDLVARAFESAPRVDLSIDCVIEGRMGRALTDSRSAPTVFELAVGPFRYFGGNVKGSRARAKMKNLERHALLMPSAPGWLELAQETHGERLVRFKRFSYDANSLSESMLDDLLLRTKLQESIKRINGSLAEEFLSRPEGFVDLSEFRTAENFVRHGVGFCIMSGSALIGAAYSSLACSKGIEVSIYVVPGHRRRGIATALACMLLKNCLRERIEPHWDAANHESCLLAEKLGYSSIGAYDAFYLGE